jgi:hypothetical protein
MLLPRPEIRITIRFISTFLHVHQKPSFLTGHPAHSALTILHLPDNGRKNSDIGFSHEGDDIPLCPVGVKMLDFRLRGNDRE